MIVLLSPKNFTARALFLLEAVFADGREHSCDPDQAKGRLTGVGLWAINDGGQDAQYPKREKGNGVFDVHARVSNDVRNARDQEKDSRSHTNEKEEYATPEKSLLIHEQRSPFVR
jgi:hypothetical protein